MSTRTAATLRLNDLIVRAGGTVAACPAGAEAVEIAGLTASSRDVKPGWLFAALPGTKVSGVDFIAEALRLGAVAILVPEGAQIGSDAGSLILIADAVPRRRFALMAAAFYGTQPERVVAVTGTSGKSSTVSFARQIWQAVGIEAASIGTLGIDSRPIARYGALTTADPVELHADLAALAEAGVRRAAMEASSHGLDQYRVDGIRLAAAGFTGFGRDHLDYHLTADAYLAAKQRLFTEVLPTSGIAVLNADIPEYGRLADATTTARRRVISYGARGHELRFTHRRASSAGQYAKLAVGPASWDIELPLVGAFQLMNVLCALGLVLASELEDLTLLQSDADEDECRRRIGGFIGALGSLRGVRGRLEHVASLPNGAAIYVDYAHKPDALLTVLDALRPHAVGRLIVAFGCGGDRDAGKRPLMGAIAAKRADRVIVTDDNPRSENPASIRAAILAASPGALEVGDREEAIAASIRMLGPGDVLVIAGKGHELGQIVGNTVRPFDDAEIARKWAAEIGR